MASDLKERIEHQRLILSKFLKDPSNMGKVIDYCILVDCGMRKVFGEFLKETIEVLEETRRSFRIWKIRKSQEESHRDFRKSIVHRGTSYGLDIEPKSEGVTGLSMAVNNPWQKQLRLFLFKL